MESSSTPASRYIAQSSKKRVFPGGSSSSGFKEVEVLETAPSTNRISKPMSSAKQKEVVCEIIDVDIEEDCGDAMLIDGEVDRRGKGKEALSNFSVDLSDDGSGDDGSDSDIQMSNDVTADDFNSNLFYGEDEWIDTYYDDITYDDYSVLESHFDQMDIPTGVEVPFPWLPISPQSNTNVPAPSTSTSSSLQIESSASHLGPDSSSSSLLLKSMWAKDQKAALHSKIGTMKEKIASTQFETIGHGRKKPTGSSSTAYLSSQSSWGTVAYKPEKEPLLSLGKSKRKSRASNVNFSPHSQFPSGGTGTLLLTGRIHP
ncbi:hypothetical protein DH2020_031663 [Rehmannia glutinosa]|uniref:Uncharacterized protein n=1 Tax=Rehmannia glutinosa TaxID=99300 RepID=A0ABR0VHF2_REHGL